MFALRTEFLVWHFHMRTRTAGLHGSHAKRKVWKWNIIRTLVYWMQNLTEIRLIDIYTKWYFFCRIFHDDKNLVKRQQQQQQPHEKWFLNDELISCNGWLWQESIDFPFFRIEILQLDRFNRLFDSLADVVKSIDCVWEKIKIGFFLVFRMAGSIDKVQKEKRKESLFEWCWYVKWYDLIKMSKKNENIPRSLIWLNWELRQMYVYLMSPNHVA